ncbi:MAG: hypothetical protein KKB81_02100 [Candidatus Margulisbacteria bacterium]|nr:hypothetical protein [Candidatus Margulisiibacteriota bacterium]MBU1022574.1 hypothetical protein [Candidatus Margulisiibacteriota bacterium]MBU1728860.1 hypothetical protein [Candidatus Margulisiibacteriota bacterium]MBU1955491.1 hypothetical protein [Candidatus Margulisiibacteriota bacterium]
MKKILLALLVVSMLASASFAVPVGKYGFGMQGLTLTTGAITMPTIQYYLDENRAIEGGLAFGTISAAGASVTNFTLMVAMKMGLASPSKAINTHWGGAIAYTSNPAFVNNTTNLLIAINLGAEVFLTPDFSIEGNVVPLAYNSLTAAGAATNTISILNSATGIPAASIGVHVYL